MTYDWTSLRDRSAVVKERFPLEVLTPLIMHGARRSQAESRPPSFKGVLRYWWRSIQPANLVGKTLFQREVEHFGGVESPQAQKSPVRIFFNPVQTKVSDQALLLPHKERSPRISAIPPGTALELVAFLPQRYASEREWFSALFRLTFVLSGFGQRSRRGAGALQYRNFRWADRSDLVATLADLLERLGVRDLFHFPQAKDSDLVLERRTDLTLDQNGVPRCSRPLLWRVWIGSSLTYGAAEAVRKKISEAGHKANRIIREEEGNRTAAHNCRLLGDIKDGKRKESQRLASPLHATVRRLKRIGSAFDGAMDKEAEFDGVLADEAATKGAGQYAYVPVVTEVCPVGYSKDVIRLYEERKREFLEILGIRP